MWLGLLPVVLAVTVRLPSGTDAAPWEPVARGLGVTLTPGPADITLIDQGASWQIVCGASDARAVFVDAPQSDRERQEILILAESLATPLPPRPVRPPPPGPLSPAPPARAASTRATLPAAPPTTSPDEVLPDEVLPHQAPPDEAPVEEASPEEPPLEEPPVEEATTATAPTPTTPPPPVETAPDPASDPGAPAAAKEPLAEPPAPPAVGWLQLAPTVMVRPDEESWGNVEIGAGLAWGALRFGAFGSASLPGQIEGLPDRVRVQHFGAHLELQAGTLLYGLAGAGLGVSRWSRGAASALTPYPTLRAGLGVRVTRQALVLAPELCVARELSTTTFWAENRPLYTMSPWVVGVRLGLGPTP